MLMEVIAGLLTSALSAGAALAWRHRGRLGIARSRTVRVSFCALLRVRDDDRFVLFHSIARPGSYGPPGGVYKYDEDGEAFLHSIGYLDEPKPPTLSKDRRHDLRGFITLGAVPAFVRWFKSGRGRESSAQCLRRELSEELAEVEAPQLIPHVAGLTFTPVRHIFRRPQREPGSDNLHLRQFEIFDINTIGNPDAAEFKRTLLELAEDPAYPFIISVGIQDIDHGRCAAGLIGGHSAYLTGTKQRHPIVPALR